MAVAPWLAASTVCSDAKSLSDGDEAVAFHGVGEETAASNTNKSAWRNVLQKSSEEFIAVEGHELAAAAVAVILHPEADAGVVDVDESAVADGHAVDVAGEVAQHLSRSSKWWLRVYHPFRCRCF